MSLPDRPTARTSERLLGEGRDFVDDLTERRERAEKRDECERKVRLSLGTMTASWRDGWNQSLGHIPLLNKKGPQSD